MYKQDIMDLFEERARSCDGQYAIAYAILEHVRHQADIAYNLKQLGLGDAASPMGAIELLSVQIKDSFQQVAAAISELKSED